ncbi:carboxypeptidase s precursor [Naematelia encephala]|uniref:Carboxypeptidase s n=1 Tax=Naematelia encephala TaxID=71784 RepID=A0A1Y2BCF2_9TREE|nr:carboxypeptidase s precursor [Naematelia encephala]
MAQLTALSPGALPLSQIAGEAAYWEDFVGCPNQPKPLYPRLEWNMTSADKKLSIERLSQAVQIPTETFDDNGDPSDDARWKPCFDFLHWLKQTFPLIHETAKIEYINTLGILATFEGSDPSLKPLLLMSHYDVVPAPSSTFDRWTHGAFSGFNDGEFVWGRGAADDKSLLVAQWEGITHLLESGFKPRRTLILTHGFDEEEMTARRGQAQIAPFLEARYGPDSLLMVIDEGTGTDDMYGAPFAIPGMGEKGYMDLTITVGTDGGHSSRPPVHSGIGIMSQVINGLETNPFEPKLTPASPILTSLMCAAKYSPDFPKSYKAMLESEGPKSWPKLAKMLSEVSVGERALISTTTAVDVIRGGVKVNALPELVTAMVNFRIDFSENIASTQAHVVKIASEVARKNDLAFSAFKGNDTDGDDLKGRYIKIDLWGLPVEPAPRTPSSGGVWELFAGTVKAAFPGPDGEERIVTPSASTGNTDTSQYYRLSKNIYRFMATPEGSGLNHHTVDERASIEAHYGAVKWIHAIVQNADAYDGEE